MGTQSAIIKASPARQACDGEADPERSLHLTLVHLALILTVAIQAGCTRTPVVTHTCSIVSFDTKSNEYTLIYKQPIGGKPTTKRLIAKCAAYQWGDREVLTGPTVCKLVVGTTLQENSTLGRRFLSFYQASSDTLAIMEGIGPNRVVQQFNVLKQEVIDP